MIEINTLVIVNYCHPDCVPLKNIHCPLSLKEAITCQNGLELEESYYVSGVLV